MKRHPGTQHTRREVLAAGLAGAVAFTLGGAAVAEDPSAGGLITRPIPATGERLPVIGLGTNAYGVSDPAEYAARREVLEQMPGLGGTVVDTAFGYGDSELVIGRAMKELGNRDRLFLATKTPMRGELADPAALVEESFGRLQVETLDLVQVHNLHGLDVFMPILMEMKASKRIRYVGMSTSSDSQYPAFLEGLNRYPVDFLQVDYSVGNRTAAEKILPFAQEKGIAVLVNMPLGGRRGPMFGQVSGKAVPDWAQQVDIHSWAQFFLKYVVSHPAVTCAIPGTTKLKHLVDNQQAGRGRLPDAAMRERMEDYWDAV